MQHLTTLFFILSTSLSLTTSTTAPYASNTTAAATMSTSYPSAAVSTNYPTASSLALLTLSGGTANPALTLFMYADPDCTDINSTYNTLTNALPLSYNAPSPQYPFYGFQMTRNLTRAETLTFYSTTNASADACGAAVADVTAGDGGAGWCVPLPLGATCYNLTQS